MEIPIEPSVENVTPVRHLLNVGQHFVGPKLRVPHVYAADDARGSSKAVGLRQMSLDSWYAVKN